MLNLTAQELADRFYEVLEEEARKSRYQRVDLEIWLEVGQEEQQRRFEARIEDPLRQWKLSPMDLESYGRWYAYSRARDMMLEATDTKTLLGT